MYKVVLVGNSNAGKTSIVSRYVSNSFNFDETATIGAAFTSYSVVIGEQKIRLNIWDTAGQERYKSLVSLYYRDVDICIIVADTSDYKIKDIEEWITEYERKKNKTSIIVVVANKCDLSDNYIPIKEYCDMHMLLFAAVSAKTGEGINNLFDSAIRAIMNLSRKSMDNDIINIGTIEVYDKNECYC